MIRALRGEIEALKSKLNSQHSSSALAVQANEHNLSASETTRRVKGEKNLETMSKEQLLAKISELGAKLAEAERDSKERGAFF